MAAEKRRKYSSTDTLKMINLSCIALVLAYCIVQVSCFAAPLRHDPLALRHLPTSATSRMNTMTQMSSEEATETTDSSAPEVPLLSFNKTHTAKLLDDALRYNSSAAKELLSNLDTMRSNNVTQAEIERYVNHLLDIVNDYAWWSVRALRRFSRRARRASLVRVLHLSMPVDETQESNDPKADEQRRKRRSLVVLLRALADDELKESSYRGMPAITLLEKAARREQRDIYTTQDMATRLPEGLETPEYSVICNRAGYEIRNYKPFSVCSVAMNKPRPADSSKTDATTNPQLAGASSFGALAGYLFGKNQESTAMKMTTPVLKTGEGDDSQMSFVLPSEFWNGVESAPKPLDKSGVVLEMNDGGDFAVVMFGGFAGKKDVEERKKQLLEILSKDSEWTAEPNATITLAQYNDPFTPPWKRRNEVSIKVVRKAEKEMVESS